ncbi:MAG: bile acid:sodium symporter family protein [Bacteroidia bacterium]
MDQFFSSLFLPATLVVIMVGVGLSLTLQSFRNIIVYPKAITLGLVAQMVLLPLLAFFIADRLALAPEFKVGLVLIAACPGGASAGLITHLLRGNVALSVSLTSVNSLLTIFTIPFITNLALQRYMAQSARIVLPFGQTIVEIGLLTLLPALVGVLVRYRKPIFARKLERPLRFVMPTLLLMAFAGIIIFERGGSEQTVDDFISLIWPNIMLNLLGMVLGFLVALLFRLGPTSRMTIAIEVGLQNSSLAIFVAQVLIGSSAMALVAVVYGSFTFGTAVLFGMVVYRLNRWVRKMLRSARTKR